MTKRTAGIIAGIMAAVSTCLLFVSASPASAQPDFYLWSAYNTYAKYNATAHIWRTAADTATQLSYDCLNSACTKVELQEVGTGDCMEYVSGTGVTNASCTGDARQSWVLYQANTVCSGLSDDAYILENAFFSEILNVTDIGTSLTIGSLTCDQYQEWYFAETGP
jgi:hypothetical protein